MESLGPMIVWRICRREHLALDGEGARLYGGRWNRQGTAIVYTSGSLALAALELFVHLDPGQTPPGLVALRIEIPEDAAHEETSVAELPRNWRRYPPPEQAQAVGDAWVAGRETLVLGLPSVVIPEERNYLLNPRHPDMTRVRARAPVPFSFDPRMWK